MRATISNLVIGNNSISVIDGELVINGEKHKLPNKCFGTNVSQINNKLYINGYEFKNGEFKRTFMAFWHMIF